MMGHKRDRNKVKTIDVEPIQNKRDQIVKELRADGFNVDSMTEFELAMLVQMGAFKNEVVDAVDKIGALVEEIWPEEEG